MVYDDFKLNTAEFEKMAKVFSYQKEQLLENESKEENNISSLKQSLEKDILSGIKIFERIITSINEKSKNEKLNQFISHFSSVINNLDLSFVEMPINGLEIDFEYPQNEKNVIEMLSNIILGVISNLTSLYDYIDNNENKKNLMLNIEKLTIELKALINL